MSCQNKDYSPRDQTWSKNSTLQYGNWTPYNSNGCGPAEYYGCSGRGCGVETHNTSQTSWNVPNNVMPDNHRIFNQVITDFKCDSSKTGNKEKYSDYNPSNYRIIPNNFEEYSGNDLNYRALNKTGDRQQPFETYSMQGNDLNFRALNKTGYRQQPFEAYSGKSSCSGNDFGYRTLNKTWDRQKPFQL
jgi:hypothetical protein